MKNTNRLRKSVIADDFPCIYTNVKPSEVWVYYEAKNGKDMIGYSLDKAVNHNLVMVEKNVSFGGEYWKLKLAPRNSRVRILLT